ncbi:hypothetical protein AMATHDRAFT_3287 [Amanita thiersii Skay4041]|uniref:C2 NT-type domain-containing protein n=1 Tax=Amanita thiersii Skay4041 TaxID=703135 RepID=A0A2A9NU24_9AGAR|nr:hypothetical protein AMATHDRAFT_3287 [Amanita thiersii Skay4041]
MLLKPTTDFCLPLHCQDDSYINTPPQRLAVDTPLYSRGKHGNRSAPNLLEQVSQQSIVPSHPTHTPLQHFSHRHAYFRARIDIHQISNVPLVNGKFSVRWKIKNVHSPPGPKNGLFGIVKGKSRPSTPLKMEFSQSEKGKSKDDVIESDDAPSHANSLNGDFEAALPSVVVSSFSPVRTNTFSSIDSRSSTSSSSSATLPTSGRSSLYSPDPSSSSVLSPRFSPFGFNARSTPSHLSFASPTVVPTPTFSPRTVSSPTLLPLSPPVPLTAVPSTARQHAPAANESMSRSSGETRPVDLKDHSVKWQHSINTVLRLDIARHTGALTPSPMKLIVIQHAVRNDPGSIRHNQQFGSVHIDLAKYVDRGAVEQKFLLKDSKSNTTIKLTINLENMGTGANYVTSPVPKGEISSSITCLLEKDLHLTMPRSIDARGRGLNQGVAEWGQKERSTSRHTRKSGQLSDLDDSESITGRSIPFSVENLQAAHGTKTTEALIDAIFNPVMTSERSKESPFTIYVSPGEIDSESNRNPLEVNLNKDRGLGEEASIYSSASSDCACTAARTVSSSSSSMAPSLVSSIGSSKHSRRDRKLQLQLDLEQQDLDEVGQPLPSGHLAGVKGWWKKRVSSRPGTPTFGR